MFLCLISLIKTAKWKIKELCLFLAIISCFFYFLCLVYSFLIVFYFCFILWGFFDCFCFVCFPALLFLFFIFVTFLWWGGFCLLLRALRCLVFLRNIYHYQWVVSYLGICRHVNSIKTIKRAMFARPHSVLFD